MKRKLSILFILILTHVIQAQPLTSNGPIQRIDKMAQSALEQFNVPGMAIAIVQDQSVLLSKGYGVRSVSTLKPVTDSTLFAIASNSKAFTAAALAIMVDRGQIAWDDKVRKYLPYFTLYNPYVSEAFTIRDLLCHRSGLDTFSGDLSQIWS